MHWHVSLNSFEHVEIFLDKPAVSAAVPRAAAASFGDSFEEEREPPKKKKKKEKKHQPKEKTPPPPKEQQEKPPPDPAIEAEMKAARERAEIPIELRLARFKEMLQEKEVSCSLLFLYLLCSLG